MIFLCLIQSACSSLAPATPTAAAPAATPVSVTEAAAEPAPGLGGVPCPDSDFTCITLTVPLNHFDPNDPRTIDVVFAILPAAGERKGMFVTATGGPGSAGISSADDYTSAFDPSIPEHFDIIFFDQRGVGQSGGLQCVGAAAKYYQADWSAGTPQEEAALTESARTFAADCASEMDNPEILPYIGTEQSVEDLESFRQAIGDEKFWLYGESYGTQYSQTYAASHPGNLAGLILDGTVDLTLSGFDFYEQQARAFSNTLTLTLQACNEDALCAESMAGGDAVAAYNKLAKKLKQAPLDFTFPLPSGGTAGRTFSFSDLETSASGYMYSASERMIFLRALAAYAGDEDLAPMARILYNSLAIDPETLDAVPDPSWSDAVFYGVECQDYGYMNGTARERTDAYLRAGDELDASLPYFSSIFYGDMPCMFWPNARAGSARPAPLTADGIPTLVLGAIADPATPVSNGQNVFSRLADGYLVTQDGGPHVIYGRGEPCIDDLVTKFLVEDRMPSQRQTTCEGTVSAEFVPPAPLTAGGFASPLEALGSADDEIYYLPEYYYWDGMTPTSVGCPFGGTLSFDTTDTGDALILTNCSFSKGFSMTGSGENNYDDGSFTLEVDISGFKSGTLTYTRDGDGSLHVTGQYDGGGIDLSK